MPWKILKRAFLSLLISRILDLRGYCMPPIPLAARAFGARNLPRLVLKSGYGPEFYPSWDSSVKLLTPPSNFGKFRPISAFFDKRFERVFHSSLVTMTDLAMMRLRYFGSADITKTTWPTCSLSSTRCD